MEKPHYLTTQSHKPKFFRNFYKNKLKENHYPATITEEFPQKRQKTTETHPIPYPEDPEKFYKYIDKLSVLVEIILNLQQHSPPIPPINLPTFVQALNNASKLNPAQLKICESFGVKLESGDSNKPPEPNPELDTNQLMPVESFLKTLPGKYSPWSLPLKMEVFRLVPSKYPRIVNTK